MSLFFYKLLHIAGIMMLFLAIGGAVLRASLAEKSAKMERFIIINHGLGLFIILVAGFGQLAKIGMQFPGWVIVKLIIWLVMGALILPIKKKPELNQVWWFFALAMGVFSGYLALYKPF